MTVKLVKIVGSFKQSPFSGGVRKSEIPPVFGVGVSYVSL